MAAAPRIVQAERIEQIFDQNLEDFLDCVKEAFIEYSSGSTENPLRLWVKTGSLSGLICMPGFVPSHNALAVKLLTYRPGGLGGTVALFDSSQGSLCALMDADSITQYRTAAMTVVATKLLAPWARRLGVYGAGVQARRHVLMLARVLPLDEVTIWNHREESCKRLVDELVQARINARWCDDPKEAAQELIVTATNSSVPVLMREWLPKRCHVNCIGAPQKSQRELDVKIMKDARLVIVDSRESATNESGDVIHSGVDITEIGSILKNDSDAESTNGEGLTVFKSVGIAVQDAAAAKFVWDRL